ncbi:protein ARV 2 isoform X4 [Triticum aestivum]|uniref:protein ARV 2 isoform X4 n=1 Tax=Triticum aestivum TaxID=4565 RepID=UPI001D02F429|nr:protein ARV 2-like isoform X4 [Triticum aestivum]XP_044390786.1 protein ARV 2-like isoform X4 [Triticum aestivum]
MESVHFILAGRFGGLMRIILIDLILHKTRAYRHLLFNKLHIGSSIDKGILCQFILMHIVLDAFRISVSKNNKADGDSSRNTLSTICNCSECVGCSAFLQVLGDALLGNIIFTAMLLLGVRYILKFSFDITRYRQILLAIIISSYFKLFLLTMMVWEFPSSAIFIVETFVLSSNVVALRVVTRFPKAHCVGVCFMAHAAKHLTERWLMWTP